MSHVVAASAGTLGLDGVPPTPEAVAVLRDAGIDLRGHRSRPLGSAEVRAADWIIVMGAEHAAILDRRFPSRAAETRMLRQFEPGAEPVDVAPDLEDPIGAPIEVYRHCFDIIRPCVDHFLIWLRHSH